MLTGVYVATIAEIKYEDCLLLLYIDFFFFKLNSRCAYRYLIPEAVNTVRAL